MYTEDFRQTYRLTFGAVAEQYDRARPSFPQEALDWLIPPGARDAVDVGAGTGKLTRLLVDRGLAVTAVEPDPQMLAVLRDRMPGVPAHPGSGEQLPLPDGSADLVTFAQAWHWVDPALGIPEVARVLRPGGTLALLWNIEVDQSDWLAQAMRAEAEQIAELVPASSKSPSLAAPFGPLESHVVHWTDRVGKETFVERITSHSRFLTLSPDEHAAELEHIWRVLRTDPQVKDSDTVSIRMRTDCYRATVAEPSG